MSLMRLIVGTVLLVVSISASSARDAQECIALLQNNKQAIAKSGESEGAFLNRCLKEPPSGDVRTFQGNEAGVVGSPNLRSPGVPNTVGGIVRFPKE
jgi:hypothetical protein